METVEKKKYLAGLLTKELILKYRTTLLVGEAASIFKSIFKGNIVSINTAEDIRDFLDNYSIEAEEPLVFEDVSLMSTQVRPYLLKYLEKDFRPLVVLASIDNLSPIFLSRFNKIIKIPQDFKMDFTSLKSFLEEHEQDLKSNYVLPELKEESVQYCPKYYYNFKRLSIAKHENKNRNQLIKYIGGED